MAANANNPGDYRINYLSTSDNTGQEKITSLLLPPSEFEKPVARDVIHKEHVKFKQAQDQLQNQVALLCSHPKKDYVDELIQRQAGEIVELRSEVMKCRLAYEQDAADWKKRLSSLEEEHAAEVRLLEKHLASLEEESDMKLSRLNCELEQALTDKQSETSTLREKLESTQLLLEKRVHDLEEELSSVQRNSNISRRQLEAELRKETQVVEDQIRQISSLKSYICETEETHKPALAWKMEKEAADNKLKIAEAENHKLTSTLELLEVRFQALRDILSIQEQELDKAKVGGAGKSKQTSSLLTRWREKVFSLLVQQQTADILYKRNIGNLELKMRALENDLTANKAQVEVLQLSLTDKVAQLQIEVNKSQRLQQECEHTQQVAVCLDDQSKRDCHSVELLTEFVDRTKNQMDKMMKIMEEKSSVLKMCGQRVSFATNRMEFIKTQLIRKSALSCDVFKNTERNLSVPIGDRGDLRSEIRDSEKLVYQELDKLTQERDSLAAQVRADTEHWSKILADTRGQYTGEITSLRAAVEDLEQQLQHKSQECKDLREEVEYLKEDVREKGDRIKQLQTELARHERGVQSVLTDQKLKDDVRWSEQLADLERKLNTAKREHAKAVVSLRQMEQRHQRRLEQAEDLLQTTEQHLRRQIEQLEARLKSVEKERNLMMATLRQEGLLSRLKSDRGHFIQFVDEDENCSNNILRDGSGQSNSVSLEKAGDIFAHMVTSDSHTNSEKPSFLHEPVQLVLQELKSLTAAVFDGDEEDEEVYDYFGGNKQGNTDKEEDAHFEGNKEDQTNYFNT